MARIEDKSWFKHLPDANLHVYKPNFYEFYQTLHERQEIWHRRFMQKLEAPWTDNDILRDYKFTNAYRELDRASQWLVHNVLTDLDLELKDLLFRIMIYRFFNQPTTFDKTKSKYAITLPHYDDFDSDDLWEQVVTYREKVDNPWHTAYLMNPGASKPKDWNKRGLFRDDMYVNTVFNQVHSVIPQLVKVLKTAKSPYDITACLEQVLAVSDFMSHEFYLDFAYCEKYWRHKIMAFDQNDFTNVGPGCSTGLRLIFPSLGTNRKEQKIGLYWLKDLADEAYDTLGLKFKYLHWDKQRKQYYIDEDSNNLTLHTYEFWCCEYQKYKKMQWGEGKQRTKFIPKTNVNGTR